MSNNNLKCQKCKSQHHPVDDCGYYQIDWEKQCKVLEGKLDKAVCLINNAYEIVELWDCKDSLYNIEWKKSWLKKAKELGASGE